MRQSFEWPEYQKCRDDCRVVVIDGGRCECGAVSFNSAINACKKSFEEWSSQQPEDEVLEALKALAQRHKWNGHGTGGCVCKEHLKAEEILAKHKERKTVSVKITGFKRGKPSEPEERICRFCNKNIKDCQCADGSDVQTEGAS